MSATTIASYGGDGQKDVCFKSWLQAQISSAFDWRGMVESVGSATVQCFIPWLFDAHRRCAELTTPVRRCGEIGEAEATL